MRKITDNRITNWQVENCNLFRFDILPETSITLDRIFHEEIAIIGFKDCTWNCKQNGQRYLETPDCIIVRDAGQVFSIESSYIAKWGATCREIRVTPSRLNDISYHYGISLKGIDFGRPILTNFNLRHQFFRTHEVLETSDCLLEKSSYLAAFLKSLISPTNFSENVRNEGREKHKIKTVVEYLRANYDQSISLSELAELIHTNPFVLLRQFRKTTGVTPHEYLHIYRVIMAQKFIGDGLLLRDVAQLCGFSDQSHLTRIFRKKVGVTPGQYFKTPWPDSVPANLINLEVERYKFVTEKTKQPES